MIDKIKINNRLSLSKNKRKKFSMQGSIMQKMHEHKISGGYLTLLRLTLGFTFLTTALSNLFKGAYTTSGFITTIEFFIKQLNLSYHFVKELVVSLRLNENNGLVMITMS